MITAELGARIKELRNQKGLSQEKFALDIGMDRTYFASKYYSHYKYQEDCRWSRCYAERIV